MRYFEIEFISNNDVKYKRTHESNSKMTAIKQALDNCDINYFNLEINNFTMNVEEIQKD